jgi:tetratricopeptide (TPR) repeat protein
LLGPCPKGLEENLLADQPGFDYDVFISYSSRDKEWVRSDLLNRIEEAGFRAFIDFRDFRRGAPSIKEMERGVTKCRKTLIVLTPDYIGSGWCEIENIMLQTLDPANRDLRLIPVLLAHCQKPLRIGTLTHIDFTDGADFDLAWGQLLAALEVQAATRIEGDVPPEIQAGLDEAKSLVDADKYSEAIPILEKTMVTADACDHTVAKVKVRCNLALALYEVREDCVAAERHYRHALTLVPHDNYDLRHNVLHGLGDMLIFCGRLDEAKATVHEALALAKQTGKIDIIARSLISLSLLERALGFHNTAVDSLEEAIHLLLRRALTIADDKQKENASILAVCYINKALLCRDTGDLDEALAAYGRAEEQHRISGDKLDAGKALLFCGEVHCANADWEKGFDCFRRALECFKEAANPLWGARSLEHVSRLFATHERWEDALGAMLGAAAGAEEAIHPGEQVHFLCLAAKLVREWKRKSGRENIARAIHGIAKHFPDDKQGEVMSNLSAKTGEMSDAIDKAVREDKEVHGLLNQAKEIAQRGRLHEHLANCLLDEAHHMTPPDCMEARRNLIAQAIELLKEELRSAQFPRRRGHLTGRISALYREIGDCSEALSWLKKAGEVFEKSGDTYGLANFHGSLAEIHRAEGRLEDEITAYRKVLSIIEGRSFHDLAAGTRINLAAALRYRREFAEAQTLLNEAEALCERHHFKDFISAIARNRSDIEKELQAAQAPAHTLPQLLRSLHQLVRYRPELAVAYLPFWYFAWNTELLALLRSGPHLSFMVVTDDVERFTKFAGTFRHLADHFLMTTSRTPGVKVEAGVLPIPPTWRFPATFPFLFMRRRTPESELKEHETLEDGEEDAPPNIHLLGPATILPLYMMIEAKSDVKGEGHMMALSAPYLPQEAIDLMIRRPVKELIRWRALWLPTDRSSSKDPFLTDLRIAHERGMFPVYFNRPPTSDAVAVCSGVHIAIPGRLLKAGDHAATDKWARALLKLTMLPREEALLALFDLPEVFPDTDEQASNSLQMEVHLCEFSEVGQRLSHPILLVRG